MPLPERPTESLRTYTTTVDQSYRAEDLSDRWARCDTRCSLRHHPQQFPAKIKLHTTETNTALPRTDRAGRPAFNMISRCLYSTFAPRLGCPPPLAVFQEWKIRGPSRPWVLSAKLGR